MFFFPVCLSQLLGNHCKSKCAASTMLPSMFETEILAFPLGESVISTYTDSSFETFATLILKLLLITASYL